MPNDAQEKPTSGEHLTGADYARYVMDEDTEITLTSAGEEIGELRDENERLKERVVELEKACRIILQWFDDGVDLAPKGAPDDAAEAERILLDALSGENASQAEGRTDG